MSEWIGPQYSESVKRISNVIEELRRLRPDSKAFVAWGFEDKTQKQVNESFPPNMQTQEGLLSFENSDVFVQVFPGGPMETVDSVQFLKRPFKGEFTDEALALPIADPRRLYNFLSCVGNGVELDLYPRRAPGPTINLNGCKVILSVSSLAPQVLDAALHRLLVAFNLAIDCLTENRCFDYWTQDLALWGDLGGDEHNLS